jgi:hypothetical protein
VELYAQLPAMGEGERIAETVPAGGSILELGCGTGRITRQLVGLGFRVTAVRRCSGLASWPTPAEH